MRTRKSLCSGAGLAISLFAGLAASLTVSLSAQQAVASQGMIVTGNGGDLGGVTGEPFTATRKNTTVQTLADGTRITHEATMKIARDSNGRTYHENHPMGLNSDNDFTVVTIFDPVNRVTINWNTRTRQATVFHIPAPEQIEADQSAASRAPRVVQSPPRTPNPAPQIEKLGTQTINGVVADGTRRTRVIPAGQQGNDQPITVTLETWWSPELKLTVRQVQDDPRSGLHTMELTDIERAEPDPALFQVPEGYTVKDQYPQQQNQN